MNTDKDGGPADKHIYDFPFKLGLPAGEDHSDNRLSLRAYIATAALQGMLCNGFVPRNSGVHDFNYPRIAVEQADALIAELAKERT